MGCYLMVSIIVLILGFGLMVISLIMIPIDKKVSVIVAILGLGLFILGGNLTEGCLIKR